MERGWDIYHIYCDEDYSGADSLRPDFNQMLQAAKKKKFQIVLCKTQSRFTRDMELVEKYIHGLFPIWGIRFVAVADHADSDIKGNKKARQINGLINEWYLEDLSENIRMVLDMKRRQGQYIGNFPVYGYQRDPNDKHHLIVDPEAAEVVRQIFRLALDGCGKQRIATILNDRGIMNPTRYKAEHGWNSNHACKYNYGLWNKLTVWRILRNELYIGNMVQGRTKKASYKSHQLIYPPREQWFRVEGTHEPIIDAELFWTVQKMMDVRTRGDGTGMVYPLAGLVKCMDCGSTMCKTSNGQKALKKVYYLRCKLYAESGSKKLCTRHSIRLDALLELVTERIRQYIHDDYHLKAQELPMPKDTRRTLLVQERKALKVQAEQKSTTLKQLYLDKLSGILSEGQFVELNQEFLAEKTHIEQRLAQLETELAQAELPKEKEAVLQKAQELLKLKTLPRELAVQLIERIEIGEKDPETGKQTVKIAWKF